MLLHDGTGQRLYLTETERTAFLEAADKAPREVRKIHGACLYRLPNFRSAGPHAESIYFGNGAIVFEKLEKTKVWYFRAIAVPETLIYT